MNTSTTAGLRDRIKEQLRGGLIVSCQAQKHEPLYGSSYMAAMAVAALQGGAVGIRANTPVDIKAIKQACPLPVIGLYKQDYPGSEIYITPTMREIRAVVEAGAEMVAVDATCRPRPDGLTVEELFRQIQAEANALIVADVSTFEEGVRAAEAGADFVSTTMSGYTAYSRQDPTCDLNLVARLARSLTIPVLAEGRIWTVGEACQALTAGALAVVVGTAITRPQEIVKRFVQALPPRKEATGTDRQ